MKTIAIRRTNNTIIASREAKNTADLLEQLVREGANLAYADLRDAYCVGAELTGAKFAAADLRDATLTRSNLRGASLVAANLRSAKLADANLKGATLAGSDLTDADFSGANLEGANLKDAKLNWKSNDLISELLRDAADTPEREYLASVVGKIDCCWTEFLVCRNFKICWALNVLASHSNLVGAPDCVISAKEETDERLKPPHKRGGSDLHK